MNKHYLFLMSVLISLSLSAQVTNEGTPLSWSMPTLKSSASILMNSFDIAAIQEEDKINDEDKTKPWRFGYEFNVDLGMDNSGTWDELPNGDRIWRINIISQGAKTMNFIFDKYQVPDGGKVYIYNHQRTDLLGAYTNVMNNEDQMLGTWVVEGDNVWIEYHEPEEVRGQGFLHIGKVIHGYRLTTDSDLLKKSLNSSGDCNLDVDCSIGNDFDTLKDRLKHSVALIIMQGFVCSGQLINNTSNDRAPYFLTANHCNAGPTSTWSFRFNWISPNPVCASTQNSQSSSFQTTSGATNLVSNAGTDVRLLELTGGLNSNWDLEWAGWDRTDNTPNYVVGIHHPSGDIMKVCRDNTPMVKTVSSGAQVWAITDTGGGWEIGVTEGGSSGSAIFDESGRIVGQLFGGFAACSGTSDNGEWDVYGRFAISWNNNNFGQWLDPTNSGQTALNMYSEVLSVTEEELEDQISMYPNPVSDILTIKNETNANLSYTIYSVLGKSIMRGTLSDLNNELSVSRLKNGIYIVELKYDTTSIYRKIIVSK